MNLPNALPFPCVCLSQGKLSRILLFSILFLTFPMVFSFGQNREAVMAYNKGLQHYNMQNYNFALPFLEDAVMESPDFEPAYHLLAVCYDEAGNTSKAIQNYERALKLNPNQEKVWYNLSFLYVDNNQPDEAVSALESALKVNPSYAKASNRLGILASNQNRTDDAEAYFEKAENGGAPSNADYHIARSLYQQKKYDQALEKAASANNKENSAKTEYMVAICQQKLGKEDAAIDSYRKVLEHDADYTEARIHLAILQYNRKNYERAAMHLEKACKDNPEDLSLTAMLGRSYLSMGKGDQAIAPLEKALLADSNNGELHYFLAEAYRSTGKNPGLTKSHMEKSLQLGFEHAGEVAKSERIKNYNDGILAYRAEDYQRAIKSFKLAILEDDQIPKYHYNLGLSFAKAKDMGNAEKAFKQSIKLDPAYGKAYLALANLFFDQNYLTDAAEYYEKAIRNGMKDAYVYYNLGNTHFHMQQYASAAKEYEKAIAITPDNANYLYNLGLAFAQDGKFNAAIETFDKVTHLDVNFMEAWYNKGLAHIDLEDFDQAVYIGEKMNDLSPDYAKGYLLLAVAYSKLEDVANQTKYLRLARSMDPSIKM